MTGTPVGQYTFKADVDAAHPGDETVFVNVALVNGAFKVTASVLGDPQADEDALQLGGGVSGLPLAEGSVQAQSRTGIMPMPDNYEYADGVQTYTVHSAPEQPQQALRFYGVDGNLYTVNIGADGVTASKSFECDPSIGPNNPKLAFPTVSEASPVIVQKIK